MIDCRICVQDCSIREDVLEALKENCRNYKPNPITNADKLRAMSDEELAAYIDEHTADAMWCNNPPLDCPQDEKCVDCILDWLRQEAQP